MSSHNYHHHHQHHNQYSPSFPTPPEPVSAFFLYARLDFSFFLLFKQVSRRIQFFFTRGQLKAQQGLAPNKDKVVAHDCLFLPPSNLTQAFAENYHNSGRSLSVSFNVSCFFILRFTLEFLMEVIADGALTHSIAVGCTYRKKSVSLFAIPVSWRSGCWGRNSIWRRLTIR